MKLVTKLTNVQPVSGDGDRDRVEGSTVADDDLYDERRDGLSAPFFSLFFPFFCVCACDANDPLHLDRTLKPPRKVSNIFFKKGGKYHKNQTCQSQRYKYIYFTAVSSGGCILYGG